MDGGDDILRWLYDRAPVARSEVRKAIRSFVGERTVSYRGLSWHCRPRDNSVERALWLRGVTDEEEEIDWLIGRLGAQSAFCDIGANCGVYSLAVRAKTGARVVAIEPNPIMRERLMANMALNGMSGVDIEPVAVGEAEGQARLNMGSQWDYGQASLVERANSKGIDVAVRPLLAILQQHKLPRFDAIKIDVEGFESQALGPFLRAAAESQLPSSLVVEHLHASGWEVDIQKLAEERGFTLVKRTANNLLMTRGTA